MQPVNKPISMQTNEKITQSISSSGGDNKSKAKVATSTSVTGKMASMSSENYSGSGAGMSMGGSSFSKNDIKTQVIEKPNPFSKPVVVKEDSEKQKLATGIFKGISDTGSKSTGTGLFSVMNVVNMKTSSNVGVMARSNNPINKPKQAAQIDLLDLDDDNDNNKPSENVIIKNEPNLLMGFIKPDEHVQIQPSQPVKKDNNLFANMNSKKPSSSSTPFNKLIQKFQVDQFEKHWESLPEELIEKFQSKIRTENDFKALTESLGIDIIEIIDNEIICAGLNEKKDVVLIYGIYEASGDMELRIKAKTSEEMARILKVVKLYAI